jgi:hypothetical protein
MVLREMRGQKNPGGGFALETPAATTSRLDSEENPMRRCADCGCKITACFGFCLAGDVMKWISGNAAKVRELCGKCVLRRDGQEGLAEKAKAGAF